MTEVTYLLIGAGLASGEAAKHIRRADPEGSILMVGEEPYLPYDRPPLSKEFLRGAKTRNALFFEPAEFFAERRIDTRLGVGVDQLDAASKRAALADGTSISFSKALIATGGRPTRLAVPGAGLVGVHYLRTIDDATALSASAQPGRHAVLIGAGFIGLEVAATLRQRGLTTTIIEVGQRIWPRFADGTAARAVEAYCSERGVVVRTNDEVVRIEGTDRVTGVRTRSGEVIPCDLLCIGIGITPNVELAREAGLTVENGIMTDEHLATSHPDIYAAGDVVNYFDPLFERQRRVEHWGHAEYSGQLAGENMAGAHRPYDLLTYVWSDLFDLHIEFAGDESEHDRVLVRGRLADGPLIHLYLHDTRLVGYLAVNAAARDLPPLQRLIKQKTNLAGKDAALKDPSVPFKTLV